MENDPLYYGTVTFDKVPVLKSGKAIYDELKDLAARNQTIGVINGESDVITFARSLFPEVAISNNTGQNHADDFAMWEEGKNIVTIEMDGDGNDDDDGDESKDVYIGGPAALFAAVIQATSEEGASRATYIGDGLRYVSNWKGSASIIHPFDAVPVYYWRGSNAIGIVLKTFRDLGFAAWDYDAYLRGIQTNANISTTRFNLRNTLSHPSYLGVMILNQIYSFFDTGLQTLLLGQPQNWVSREKTSAHVIVNHAYLSYQILDLMGLKDEILLKASDRTMMLSLYRGNPTPDSSVQHVQDLIDEHVDEELVTGEKLRERGYNTNIFQYGVNYRDFCAIYPWTDALFEEIIRKHDGTIMTNYQLKKILAKKTANGRDVRASRIVLEDTRNNESTVLPVRSLYLSLGPSMNQLLVASPNGNKHNVMSEIMCASASSSVMIVKIDLNRVEEDRITKFRDILEVVGMTCSRLAERDMVVEGDGKYKCFLLQVTGGGHFPSREVHPEAPLSIFKAVLEPVLELGSKGIEFDIISVRSCARGVVANNSFNLALPLSNTAMVYGIGGIGMTTMVPNALLMKAAMEQRRQLSHGTISHRAFREKMRESRFGDREIPHWRHGNVFKRDYSRMLDDSYRVVPDLLLPTRRHREDIRMLVVE